MRKHGWQLPYHPLQVVAVAVFLALGFAFYVFFVPFVGRKVYQYIVMGLYTPLITCVFGLYIWCAAADPADPGVFKSKKYVGTAHCGKHNQHKESKLGRGSTSSTHKPNTGMTGERHLAESVTGMESIGEDTTIENEKNLSSHEQSCCMVLLGFCTCAFMCNSCNQREQFSEKEMSEEGMFFCSLCEVEVFKYSKHCRVCDKCVDRFDHHCRWLNNCIGQKNYRQFFTLMVSAILLLILQWSIGILVMICCFLERNRFSVEITTKLGSSFSLVPFVVVVASCTILAMLATLPLAQLFFFHVLLIKKGISTYDYIVALREQDQLGIGGQQSPQMSTVSSLTGLSSASSFNTFHRGAWCTPPRLFLEDQFDVVHADTAMSVSSSGKRMAVADESIRKKNAGVVRLSPWTLARLNPEEVSKVATQARKKSRILQPVVRREAPLGLETDRSFGSNSGRMFQRPENRRRTSKRVRLPADLPLEPLSKISAQGVNSNLVDPMVDASTSLAPLQQEARSAFRTSRAMSALSGVIASSPESSLDSPDVHQFRISSSGAEEGRGLTANPATFSSALRGIPLSRSTSDGYEASGGEDSDRVPSRVTQRSTNWSNLFFSSRHDERALKLKESYSSSQANSRNL